MGQPRGSAGGRRVDCRRRHAAQSAGRRDQPERLQKGHGGFPYGISRPPFHGGGDGGRGRPGRGALVAARHAPWRLPGKTGDGQTGVGDWHELVPPGARENPGDHSEHGSAWSMAATGLVAGTGEVAVAAWRGKARTKKSLPNRSRYVMKFL